MTKLSNKKIKTLKSFLTEEEANEIIPLVKKYYGNYAPNLILQEDISASSIIYWGFHWKGTSEGHEYWHDLRGKILARESQLL